MATRKRVTRNSNKPPDRRPADDDFIDEDDLNDNRGRDREKDIAQRQGDELALAEQDLVSAHAHIDELQEKLRLYEEAEEAEENKRQEKEKERHKREANPWLRHLELGIQPLSDLKISNDKATASKYKDLLVITKTVKPFAGKPDESVEEFLHAINRALISEHPLECDLIRILINKLEGKALDWYNTVHGARPNDLTTAKTFIGALNKAFNNEETRNYAFWQLDALVKTGQRDSSVDEYYSKFYKLMKQVSMTPETAALKFVEGLRPSIKRALEPVQLQAGLFKDVTSVLTYANRAELREKTNKDKPVTPATDHTKPKDNSTQATVATAQYGVPWSGDNNGSQGGQPHGGRDNRPQGGRGNPRYEQRYQPSHARDELRRDEAPPPVIRPGSERRWYEKKNGYGGYGRGQGQYQGHPQDRQQHARETDGPHCFNCGGVGHIARFCSSGKIDHRRNTKHDFDGNEYADGRYHSTATSANQTPLGRPRPILKREHQHNAHEGDESRPTKDRRVVFNCAPADYSGDNNFVNHVDIEAPVCPTPPTKPFWFVRLWQYIITLWTLCTPFKKEASSGDEFNFRVGAHKVQQTIPVDQRLVHKERVDCFCHNCLRYSSRYRLAKRDAYCSHDKSPPKKSRPPSLFAKLKLLYRKTMKTVRSSVHVVLSTIARLCATIVLFVLPPLATKAHQAFTIADRSRPTCVEVNTGGTKVNALVDTGATLSLISESLAHRLGLKAKITPWKFGPVKAANGTALNIRGICPVSIQLGEAEVNYNAVVVRHLSRDLIIGTEVMRDTGMVINFDSNTICLRGCAPTEMAKEGESEPSCVTDVCHVYAHNERVIPPRSEAIIELDIRDEDRSNFHSDCGMVIGDDTPITEMPALVGASITQTVAGKLCCRVANPTKQPITIESGQRVGTIHAVDSSKLDEHPVDESEIDNKVPPVDLEKTILTPEQKKAVRRLLYEYRDVFAEELQEVGGLRGVECTIDLKPNTKPVHIKDYRKSPKEHAEIKKMNDLKLRQGQSEPATGEWSAPTLLAPKKTGGVRLCSDLRSLNAVTETMVFPMPRSDDMFDAVAGARWFSLADATWGYWQVKLRESDREKCAYMTREGLWQPTTMDFGMKNAPAIWQRAMHTIFSGLLWVYCVIYLDDLLIYSKTFEEHLESMRMCLQRCREANLKLRPSKCDFFKTKINFLGHYISGEGVEMDPKKVSKIVDAPIPTSASQLNSWICLAQYYRAHIKNFSDEVRILRDLVLAKQYIWEEKHTQAFNRLKKLLAENVVLAHPIPDRPFIVQCDASNFGIGYILAQKDDDGNERVVCFGSRTLTPTERNYSTTEKECLAIVEAVKQYHVYLHGQEFVVVTDHKALQWLMQHKDYNSKLMRWAIKLQGYNFHILHRQGKYHGNVDALSRLVDYEIAKDNQPVVNAVDRGTNTLKPINIETIREYQQADPVLREYYNFLTAKKLPKDYKRANLIVATCRYLEVEDGVLYHIWWPEGRRHRRDTRRQLAIPEALRAAVLEECHDSNMTGGHLGFNKTHCKIRERYWWPRHYSDTRRYVLGCRICQQRKGARPMDAGLVQPIVAKERFELVGVDLFGPLPEDENGYKYIIVFTDHFSKWVEAYPLKHASEAEAAEALAQFICKHGTMARLISDRGPNFIGAMVQELYKFMGTRKVTTTAWHPQANGQTEAFNKPLANMLASYVEQHRDWVKLLPFVIFAYNVAVNEVTKFSPYYLVYCREPRFPLEVAAGTTEWSTGGSYASVAEELEHKLHTAFKIVRHNQANANFKMITSANRHRKEITYRAGDRVWLYVKPRTDRSKGTHKKLKFPWQGPYVVVKQPYPNSVQLRKENGGRMNQLVHVNRLKLYKEQRPLDAPHINDDDDFEYEEEHTVDDSILGTSEAPPPDEVGVDKILQYRITPRGMLEFQVQWTDDTTTWESEATMNECEAVDKFYVSKPRYPLFGLEIHLRKFNILFGTKKYNYNIAKDQLEQAVTEFVKNDKVRAGLLSEIRPLYTILEVRAYVTDFLSRFKDKMGEEIRYRNNNLVTNEDTVVEPQAKKMKVETNHVIFNVESQFEGSHQVNMLMQFNDRPGRSFKSWIGVMQFIKAGKLKQPKGLLKAIKSGHEIMQCIRPDPLRPISYKYVESYADHGGDISDVYDCASCQQPLIYDERFLAIDEGIFERFCWRCLHNVIWMRRTVKAMPLLLNNGPISNRMHTRPIAFIFMLARQFSLLLYTAREFDPAEMIGRDLYNAQEFLRHIPNNKRQLAHCLPKAIRDFGPGPEPINGMHSSVRLHLEAVGHAAKNIAQWIVVCKYCGEVLPDDKPKFTVSAFPANLQGWGESVPLCNKCSGIISYTAELLGIEMYKESTHWTFIPNADLPDQFLNGLLRMRLETAVIAQAATIAAQHNLPHHRVPTVVRAVVGPRKEDHNKDTVLVTETIIVTPALVPDLQEAPMEDVE